MPLVRSVSFTPYVLNNSGSAPALDVLDLLFPGVTSATSGEDLTAALAGAADLARAWEQRCASVRRQLAAAEERLPQLLMQDQEALQAVVGAARAAAADVHATLRASDGECSPPPPVPRPPPAAAVAGQASYPLCVYVKVN
jgi:hypothetical protein